MPSTAREARAPSAGSEKELKLMTGVSRGSAHRSRALPAPIAAVGLEDEPGPVPGVGGSIVSAQPS